MDNKTCQTKMSTFGGFIGMFFFFNMNADNFFFPQEPA